MRTHARLASLGFLVLSACAAPPAEPGRSEQAQEVDSAPSTVFFAGLSTSGVGAVGETLTAPTSATALTSVSMMLGSSGANLIMHIEVYAWNGSNATGAALFDSPPFVAPPPSGPPSALQPFPFATNIAVTPGQQYILFVSVLENGNQPGQGYVGASSANAYAGGTAQYLSNSDVSYHSGWAPVNGAADIAFTATWSQVPTTTTLSASPSPSSYGQSVTLTANVTSSNSTTPTGTVTFYDNGTSLGTAMLDGTAKATFSTSALTGGSHSLSATYNGAGLLDPSTGTASLTVQQGSSTTTVSSSGSPSQDGHSVTFTATIGAVSPATGARTGTVTFTAGSTTLCSAASISSNIAICTYGALPLGTTTVTATYSGDGNYAGSNGSVSQVVNQDSSSVSVSSSKDPSSLGDSVTFTISVTGGASGSGTPGGSVTVTDGTTTIATLTLSNGGATFATSALATGSHTIAAAYGGDTNHASGSGSVVQVVNKATSTTTLTSTTNPTVTGQSTTLTATVTSGATGSVTFYDGMTSLGSVALNTSGVATFSSVFSTGSHSLSATYGGDGSYTTSTGTLTQTVNLADTSTALTSSTNPSVVNGGVTFTATVRAKSPGAGSPSGSVTFSDGSTTLGTGALSSGSVTYTTNSLSVGSHTITASYGGDASFNASTNTLTQVVNVDGASVSVATSLSPSTFGGSVTFTATLTSSGTGGTPTGSVSFADGTTSLGTGTLSGGVATLTTSALQAGSHTINVAYGGDTKHGAASGSVSQTVSTASTTTSVASNDTSATIGASVTLTATVSTSAGTVTGTVDFKDGSTDLGSAMIANGMASYTTSAFAAGQHAITATYSGDTNHATSSGSLTQSVGLASTSVVVSSSANPSKVGANVTFTAAITASGTPTGSVDFYDGTTKIGSGTVDTNGNATFTTSSLASGTHSITATYGGDGSFATSTSDALSQVVNTNAATITATGMPNPSTWGTDVTLSVTVTGATGTCHAHEGSTDLGTATLASGAATLTLSALSVGNHTITIDYSGDATFSAETATVALDVNKATTTIAIATSSSTVVDGSNVTITATVASAVSGYTGSVELFDGSTSLGTKALAGSTASFTVDTLSVGVHVLTARYSGDTDFAASDSTALMQTIDGALGGPDGGAPVDGSTTADAGHLTTSGGSGCSCDVSHGATPSGGLALLLLACAAVVVRRRRSAR